VRATRLALLVALAAAAAVGTTSLSQATFTSVTTSGVSTVSAAADWTPPQVTLTAPGSPLSGTVVLEATATDPEGSPTTIRLDISPAGSSQWSELCTSSTSPASCSWDTTTVPDGLYDIRAAATDSSQNTAEDTVTGVAVENAPQP
jgi:chitinase